MLQKLKDKIIRKLGGYTLKDVSKTDYITACDVPIQTLKAGCSVRVMAGRWPDVIAVNQKAIEHAKETIAYEIGRQLMGNGAIKYHMPDNEFDRTRRDLVGILHFIDKEDPAASIAYGEKI